MTLSKYRYQHFWSAYYVLKTLFIEYIIGIYCEFLDDIAIEYKTPDYNRKMMVIQVKHKDSQKFSLANEEIGKTINIFFNIEKKFGNEILNYKIITNGIFIKKSKDIDIYKIIKRIKSKKNEKEIVDFIKNIPAIKSRMNCEDSIILNVIKKLQVEPQRRYSSKYLDQQIEIEISKVYKKLGKIIVDNLTIQNTKAQIMDYIYRKSCNEEYDEADIIYEIKIDSLKGREEDKKQSKKIEKDDILMFFNEKIDKIHSQLKLLPTNIQLEEKEKDILLILQKTFNLKINSLDNIYQSSPNGIKIEKGRIVKLKLTNLKQPIDAIPSDIFELKNLKFLNLSSNNIEEIPIFLKKLNELEEFHLEDNKISKISEGFSDLNSLRILNLSNNRIRELDGKFLNLNRLEELDVSKNPISSIIGLENISSNTKIFDVSFSLISEELKKKINRISTNQSLIKANFKDTFSYHNYCLPKSEKPLEFNDFNEKSLSNKSLLNFKTAYELAYFLKIHLKTLKVLLRTLSVNIHASYKIKVISKSNKNIRFLHIPKDPNLEKVQNIIFREILRGLDMGVYSYGFVVKKSIRLNALNHLKSVLLFTVDLKDFFFNISSNLVYIAFKNLGYSSGISAILTRITCYTNIKNDKSFLPQGTHTSPSIANLVFKPIDYEIDKLAEYYSFRFTRYGDDLNFSSKSSKYAPREFIKKLFKILNRNGFRINMEKFKFSRPSQRQVVTGILVNGKECALPRKQIKRIRAGLFNISQKEIPIQEKLSLYGMCKLARSVNYEKYSFLLDKFNEIDPEFEDNYKNGNLQEIYNFYKQTSFI